MNVFCLSDSADKPGYATGLLMEFLVVSHNAVFSQLKKTNSLETYFTQKSKKLFRMNKRNFFKALNFNGEEEELS